MDYSQQNVKGKLRVIARVQKKARNQVKVWLLKSQLQIVFTGPRNDVVIKPRFAILALHGWHIAVAVGDEHPNKWNWLHFTKRATLIATKQRTPAIV